MSDVDFAYNWKQVVTAHRLVDSQQSYVYSNSQMLLTIEQLPSIPRFNFKLI